MAKQSVFPRWRGFNLRGMFCSETSAYYSERSPGHFEEEDFKMISDLGFNFVRLPLSYRVWSSVEDPFSVREEKLAPLDEAVYWGQKYGLHVNICLHRIPGFCVNKDEATEERLNVWTDEEAVNASAFQWGEISKRYADVSSDALSFNVVNEPSFSATVLQYETLVHRVLDAARAYAPHRLFIIDGIQNGYHAPTKMMCELENCGYSMRGYQPGGLTHYSIYDIYDKYLPCWPNGVQIAGDKVILWDRARIDRYFGMWAALSEQLNVGVHCGEMGCYNQTPHNVTLAWYEDMMQSLQSFHIGYAIWNFRGPFGVMDSGRSDVTYKKYGGHLLDEKLMKLLQKYN